MIFWKDFVFDQVLGPVLDFVESDTGSENHDRPADHQTDIMDDGNGEYVDNQYQETRQNGQRPARMAGTESLQCQYRHQSRESTDASSGEPSGSWIKGGA